MERTIMLIFALLGAATCSDLWTPEPEFHECCAIGDPHYYLFDGHQQIHYQGQCKYLMAGTCHDCQDCDHEAFHVYVDNRPWQYNNAMSVTDLVEIHFAGAIVEFQFNAAPLINGATEPMPYVGAGFVVSNPSTNHFVFEATNGLRVTYQNGHHACVRVPNCVYRDQMCGICGNMNNIEDDYFTSDGTDVSTHWNKYNLIGDSWEVPDGDCPTDQVARKKRAAARAAIAATEIKPHPCCQKIHEAFPDCYKMDSKMMDEYVEGCNIDANAAQQNQVDSGCCMMVEALVDTCTAKEAAPVQGYKQIFDNCYRSTMGDIAVPVGGVLQGRGASWT